MDTDLGLQIFKIRNCLKNSFCISENFDLYPNKPNQEIDFNHISYNCPIISSISQKQFFPLQQIVAPQKTTGKTFIMPYVGLTCFKFRDKNSIPSQSTSKLNLINIKKSGNSNFRNYHKKSIIPLRNPQANIGFSVNTGRKQLFIIKRTMKKNTFKSQSFSQFSK